MAAPPLPPLPTALPPADADANQERIVLAAKRTEIEAYLTALPGIHQAEQQRLAVVSGNVTEAQRQLNALFQDIADAQQRHYAAIANIQRQESNATEELKRRLGGALGARLDQAFVLAANGARLMDHYNATRQPAPIPLMASENGFAEELVATISLMDKRRTLENTVAALEAAIAQRFGVQVSNAAASGRLNIQLNQDALAIENSKLNASVNTLTYRLQQSEQLRGATERELTDAKQRLNMVEATQNVAALSEQYASLARLRYVQVGNIDSPEQVRLIALAADARRRMIEERAKAIADTLPSMINNSGAIFNVMLQLGRSLGGMSINGGAANRLVFSFSNERDADTFITHAGKSGYTALKTPIADTAIVVTVSW